jgi:hypothetical protein
MRTVIAAILAMFLASCATATPSDTTTVYHHKYHQFYTVKKQPEKEFVGAGVKEGELAKRNQWLRDGSPRNYPY